MFAEKKMATIKRRDGKSDILSNPCLTLLKRNSRMELKSLTRKKKSKCMLSLLFCTTKKRIIISWYKKRHKVAEVIVDADYEDDGYKYIGNLEVCEHYRRQGIGKQIIEFLLSNYKAGGITVLKDNEIAFNLYRKCGFEVGVNKFDDDAVYCMYYEKV